MILAAVAALAPHAVGAAGTHTWTGAGDGVHWSDAANWTGGVPGAGDAAVLPAGVATTHDLVDDIAGLGLAVMAFHDTYAVSASVPALGVSQITVDGPGSHPTVSAPLALSQSLTLSTGDPATLTLSGALSGQGALVVATGTVTLGGADWNTYNGFTSVAAGARLVAAKTGGAVAVPRESQFGYVAVSGTLQEMGDGEVAPTVLLGVFGGHVLLGGHSQSFTDIQFQGNGGVMDDGAGGRLTAGHLDTSTRGSSVIGSPTGNAGVLALPADLEVTLSDGTALTLYSTLDGPGELDVDVRSGPTGGEFHLAGSDASPHTVRTNSPTWLDGSRPATAVTALAGQLRGAGTVGTVSVQAATLDPGAGEAGSTGSLTVSGLALGATARLHADLASGSAHDALVVDGGSVSLGGAGLDLGLGYVPAPGQQITLVSTTAGRPVGGTFAGLPEGAVLTVRGTAGVAAFRISYAGGAGHDVVLTAVAPPTIAPPASGGGPVAGGPPPGWAAGPAAGLLVLGTGVAARRRRQIRG